ACSGIGLRRSDRRIPWIWGRRMKPFGVGIHLGHHLDERKIGLVLDIDNSVIRILSVEPAFLRLIDMLEPVVSDQVGMPEAGMNVGLVGERPLLLIFCMQ